MAQGKGKGKAKRRDPRKGPSASSGKRPGKGTKKVAPATKHTGESSTEHDATHEPVHGGGTAKAPFSVGRAPRPPRPAAVKALAIKAERAAATEAARARAAAPPVAPGPTRHSGEPSSAAPANIPLSTLTVGYIAGATPGRWVDTWTARNPQRRLILHPLSAAEQRPALDDAVDLALVRLPLSDDDGLQIIPLYDEVSFVVVSVDNELSMLEEISFEDLAGQVLISPEDDVLGELQIADVITPVFAPPATTEEAIATVAAGVGVVVVPQSLARLHRRKDVTSRPLRGGPTSTVAIVWHTERETRDVATFVGIVRGRTASSSR